MKKEIEKATVTFYETEYTLTATAFAFWEWEALNRDKHVNEGTAIERLDPVNFYEAKRIAFINSYGYTTGDVATEKAMKDVEVSGQLSPLNDESDVSLYDLWQIEKAKYEQPISYTGIIRKGSKELLTQAIKEFIIFHKNIANGSVKFSEVVEIEVTEADFAEQPELILKTEVNMDTNVFDHNKFYVARYVYGAYTGEAIVFVKNETDAAIIDSLKEYTIEKNRCVIEFIEERSREQLVDIMLPLLSADSLRYLFDTVDVMDDTLTIATTDGSQKQYEKVSEDNDTPLELEAQKSYNEMSDEDKEAIVKTAYDRLITKKGKREKTDTSLGDLYDTNIKNVGAIPNETAKVIDAEVEKNISDEDLKVRRFVTYTLDGGKTYSIIVTMSDGLEKDLTAMVGVANINSTLKSACADKPLPKIKPLPEIVVVSVEDATKETMLTNVNVSLSRFLKMLVGSLPADPEKVRKIISKELEEFAIEEKTKAVEDMEANVFAQLEDINSKL